MALKHKENYESNTEANHSAIVLYMMAIIQKIKYIHSLSDKDMEDIVSYMWWKKDIWKLSEKTAIWYWYLLSEIIKHWNENWDNQFWISDNEIINALWLDDLENSDNPIVIYRWSEPLYWNKAMENITWYSFVEIKEMHDNWVDIMYLLYWWSEEELNKVKDALSKWENYENAVFTLKAKNWELHQVAWFTRFKTYMWKKYSIRSWSEDTSKIIEFLDQSNIAVRDMFNDIMSNKDKSTTMHVSRVRELCSIIWRKAWYSSYMLEQLSNMAFLHDLWKRFIDDAVLKKTWKYTKEEREIMNTHSWIWIAKVLNSWYEVYAWWMVHHAKYYSKEWNPNLKFNKLVNSIKNWEEIDLLDFNRLMWANIPEFWRLIMIADSIDAMAWRRIYNDYAWKDIEEIIVYIEEELLSSSWLISHKSLVRLDSRKWRKAEKDEIDLPYCVNLRWVSHVPIDPHEIQFDPLLLMKIYESWLLDEEIRQALKKNDHSIVDEKIQEYQIIIEEMEKEMETLWEKFDSGEFCRINKLFKIIQDISIDYKKKSSS